MMLTLLLIPAVTSAGPGAPTYLRCEGVVDPLAVGTRVPRFSWEVVDRRRGAAQSAYRVLVASEPALLSSGRADLWDSAKVASSECAYVRYAGRRLASGQRCFWRVRTWDADGVASPWSTLASFGVGLLERSDWRARWIGDPTLAPEGGPEHNGYHSGLGGSADAAKCVTVDLGSVKRFDKVVLYPARPFNWVRDEPGFLFPVRYLIDTSDTLDFSHPTLAVDRTSEDQPNPGTEPVTLGFPDVTGRYVRLLVTKLAAREPGVHAFALAEMQVLEGDALLSHGAPVIPLDSIEASGWGARMLTDGDLKSHPGTLMPALPATMLRRSFRLDAAPVRATAYATALGLYELSLNGQRVGDHILAPEWTDYRTRVQYQAYDVTSLLHEGDNAVAALLGDGWYAGRIGLLTPPGRRGMYGRKPSFLAQIEIELADGSRVTVATDGSWRCAADGPVRSSDTLDGEAQDARLAKWRWDDTGFADDDWKPAAEVATPDIAIVAQPNEPIRVIDELRPVSVAEPTPGTFIFDLGQNVPGWVRMKLHASAGRTITLRHGEMLNPDGTLYIANLRSAPQVDTYVARGDGDETFEPHFTYHGFRYVEVTGLDYKPSADDLVGRALCSSSRPAGTFECSSPMLNKLWSNILWTQRANMMSVPTDCPQRDERLGWMGDIQAFSQTAIFNLDMSRFFRKWLTDVRDAQSDEGSFPDFAPNPAGRETRGAPAWGDAGTIVPWNAFVNYGDRDALAEHYDAARRWVHLVHSENQDGIWRNGRGADYGDWLNGDTLILEGWPTQGGEVPKEILATAFFARSAEVVAKMARALGKQDDAERYSGVHERIKAAFNAAYIQFDGRITGDTQAGYALALSFGLLPDGLRAAAFGHLCEAVERYGRHPSTGIQTTHRMMLELVRGGRADLAYDLLRSRTRPSWGYMIDQGATTIWERWDGYVEGRGFQNPGMNSFNHWALGSVGEWMYRIILGLQPDEEHPGWERFTVAPRPGGGLTWARGSYRSVRGQIKMEWRTEAGGLSLNVTVPPGAAALVRVPTTDAATVTESGVPAGTSEGVRSLETEPDAAWFKIGSGSYTFQAQ